MVSGEAVAVAEAAVDVASPAKVVSHAAPSLQPVVPAAPPLAAAPAIVEPPAELPTAAVPQFAAETPSVTAYPLPVRGRGKVEKTGLLLDPSGRMEFDGKLYRSPSTAARDATGWKEANGWRYWRYQHPDTGQWRLIDELRRGGESAAGPQAGASIGPMLAPYPPHAPPDATPDPAA